MAFETKVDIKYEQKNEIVIPMVSFCKPIWIMHRNLSQKIKGLSPAQVYNQTFGFAEVFIGIYFIGSNSIYHNIVNFPDRKQNNSEIYYEKTISDLMICYQFKYLLSKQLKHKEVYIYLICIIKIIKLLCLSSIIILILYT